MLSSLEKRIVRELQDLPLIPRPYALIASRLGIEEEELLVILRRFQEEGLMRRVAGVLRHLEAGITENALVVWEVPGERVKEVGRIFASFPEVTHCYQRLPREGWPYNLFTMLHGTSREKCSQVATRLAHAAGVFNYRLLFSTQELKKISMNYFQEEESSED